MIVLGLNAFHADAAACLVEDGKLIAAAEEERFRRIKHWAGFPSQAIRYCLQEAGACISDVDHVAINQDSRANMLQRLMFVAGNRPDIGLVLERIRRRRERMSVDTLLQQEFSNSRVNAQFHSIEHHLAHLSSAFHVSPFKEAVAVSVDGFGDFASAAWGVGRNADISIDGRIHFPHSLGIFYQAITQFLGFPHYGDEYKVMGLAPYGEPKFMDAMSELVSSSADGSYALGLDYFRHHKEIVPYQWTDGSPVFDELFSPALQELLGPRRKPDEPLEQRHKDIARSTQAAYEQAFFKLIEAARKSSGATDIVLSGGCANNSVANGKVRRETPYKRVYVHAAPGDAGGAIGAAFVVWHRTGGARTFVMDHAYWGPGATNEECRELLDQSAPEVAAAGCIARRVTDEGELCKVTAEAVAEGGVVGWFQGRMEWGPRALGNRSIVCDPRRGDMKAILNAKIKRREGFRPFAPSVLEDHVGEWFEEDDDVPFMTQVFQIREGKRALIPAVTHVDGSGRLQTVYRRTNPRYARLIDSFHSIAGVPMVLNTSFNENEPVVCRPREALDCFLRTKMDMLVLNDWILTRTA